MALSKFLRDLAPSFDPRAQAGGRALVRRRRVHLDDPTSWLVRATVRASDADFLVLVALREANGGVLATSCPCDAFRVDAICAHAWAALVAIDARRATARAAARRAPSAAPTAAPSAASNASGRR
jgi:hypothetical protein